VRRRAALRDLAWLLPLAALVRAVYLWQLRATPLWTGLIVDEASYDGWARAVAAGRLVGETPFYQAPLYPYALGGLYALAGPAPGLARGLQAAAGLASAALLYHIGCRVFGRAAGIAAGAGAALYAPFLFYEGSILKESWAILLTGALVLLLLRALEGPPGRWLAAGLALGLLALLRENALLYLPFLVVWNLVRSGEPDEPGRRARARLAQSALFAAGTMAALLPAAAHNLAAGGGLLLTTSQAGANLYIGNHPGAPGVYEPIRPGRQSPEFEATDARAEAERRAGRPLTPGQASRFWIGEAARFARERPREFLSLQARKLALVWNAREIPDTWDIEFLAGLVPLLRAPLVRFGWVAPVALLGIALAWPFSRAAGLLLLLALATVLSVAAFYVFARYRLPLAPLLLPFAGLAVSRALEAVRAGRFAALAAGTAALLPLALLVHLPLPWLGLRLTDEVGHQNLGFLRQDAGDREAAAAEFRSALAINPDLGNAWMALARLHAEAGDAAAQRDALERLLAHVEARRAGGVAILDARLEAEAHRELARLDRAAGDREGAAAHFRAAAVLLPESVADWIQLGIELRALARPADAAEAYRQALRRDPGEPLALVNLANLHLDGGDRDGARRLLAQAAAACATRRPDLCPEIAARLEAAR
jgi:tetratricopeptide (TPR) repeat protein